MLFEERVARQLEGAILLLCSCLKTGEFPPMETALIDGDVAFRQHSGGHTTGPNWPTFLTFASRYIKSHNSERRSV